MFSSFVAVEDKVGSQMSGYKNDILKNMRSNLYYNARFKIF